MPIPRTVVDQGTRRLQIVKALVLATFASAAVVLLLTYPVTEQFRLLAQWIRGAGVAGMVVYSLVYVLATVLLLPGSLLTLAAGFAWGPLLGTAIALPAATAASVASFVIGRYLSRAWVTKKLAGKPSFAALERAIASGGFKVVFLLRLSPVLPFNLLNYGLGLSAISLRQYAVASFVGMLPGCAMYVYLGSLVTNVADLGRPGDEMSSAQLLLYWGGLLATVIVTVVVSRAAKAELQAMQSHSHADNTAQDTSR